MTHADLVQRAVRWLRGTRKCSLVFAEFATGWSASIPDAIGWHGPKSILVECKVSRADYRADAEKRSHRAGRIMGAERWYLTPPSLLRPNEVRDGWGLAEVRGQVVRVIVPAPVVPETERCWRDEMALLVQAVNRHQLGVEWHADEARFAPYRPGAA